MSVQLAKAKDMYDRAKVAYGDALRQEYPIGKAAEWRRGGIHLGHIVAHGYFDRAQVRNAKTGRDVWITAYDIISATHGPSNV